MKPFSIGCDPEFFLKDDKDYVSSVGLIKGTKDEPWLLENGGFIMKDNVAIEFGMPPAYSEDEWLQKLIDMYNSIEEVLPKGLNIACVPSADFPVDQLQTEEACEFGCDPDYNAWTKRVNVAPEAAKLTLRSCGGHIHVGYIEGTPSKFLLQPMGKINMIRVMDAIHGITSVILDDTPESHARRELYGKAGCYRETGYGVEYRTLSNFWMKSPALMKLMYRLTDEAVTMLASAYTATSKFVGRNGKLIQGIINNANKEDALKFNKMYNLPVWSTPTVQAYEDALKEI